MKSLSQGAVDEFSESHPNIGVTGEALHKFVFFFLLKVEFP